MTMRASTRHDGVPREYFWGLKVNVVRPDQYLIAIDT